MNNDQTHSAYVNVLTVDLQKKVFAVQRHGQAVPRAGDRFCDGFDSRLEPITFDIFVCNGWLLNRRAQVHFAVSLNYCWIFSSLSVRDGAPYFSAALGFSLFLRSPRLQKTAPLWTYFDVNARINTDI